MWQRKKKSCLITQAGEGGAGHISDADHQTRGTRQSPGPGLEVCKMLVRLSFTGVQMLQGTSSREICSVV